MVDMAFGLCGNCFHGASPKQAGEALRACLVEAKRQSMQTKEEERRKKRHAGCLEEGEIEKCRLKEEGGRRSGKHGGDAASADVGLAAKCNT